MAKSASEKMLEKKQPKKVILDKDFAGIKKGQRMLVGTPQMIAAYINKIPSGETRTIHRLRNELARQQKCDATCPVSTAIFIRIAAEAALEAINSGETTENVTPFWRVLAPNDKITKRLAIDSAWVENQRAIEIQ